MSEQPWDERPWDDEVVEDGALVVTEDAEVVAVGGSAVVDMTEPLSMDEARELTETIRSTADVLYVLLARAHAGRAWEALGYGTFEAYVKEEFDISRSRAYQILNQAKVIEAIEAATPDGTNLHITEAQARDLKSVIGEVVPEIEARTRDLPGNEAAEVVEEIIEDYRDRKREEREQRALEAEEAAADLAERAGFSDGYGGDYRPPPAPPVFDEEDEIDAALIRRNVQAAYDLYSSISALKSMPEVQAVIDTIPVERRIQINESLTASVQWLNEFAESWLAQPWQSESAAASDDEDYEDYEDFGDEPEV